MENNTNTALVTMNEAKERFAVTMREAQDLDIVNNVAGAFDVAIIISKLRAVLTDDIMKQVFMPLQGQKIGFRSDKIYPVDTVRNCIIDAAALGMLPTGNQFNIIAGNMYPTKEGYTALLAKMKQTMGLVYSFEFDPETTAKSADPNYVAIPCRISYKTNRDDLKGWFKYTAMVKSNGTTSTTDQLRGKAERKCKKAFFEFLTGMDLGDADATETVDAAYTEVRDQPAPAKSAADKAREILNRRREPQPEPMQPNNAFDGNPAELSDEEIERGL
jgi:hypothetical protein